MAKKYSTAEAAALGGLIGGRPLPLDPHYTQGIGDRGTISYSGTAFTETVFGFKQDSFTSTDPRTGFWKYHCVPSFVNNSAITPSQLGSSITPIQWLCVDRRIAIDVHNCADGGDKATSKEKNWIKQVYLQLLIAGYIPWLCSYIGDDGPLSTERKEGVEALRRDFAIFCGLDPEPAGAPTRTGVFLHICVRKTWSQYHGSGGKAEVLVKYHTAVLIDDSADICKELEESGLLCYQLLLNVTTQGTLHRLVLFTLCIINRVRRLKKL